MNKEILVSRIQSLVGIKIKKNKIIYLFSKVTVYADSGNSVSYCLFTITSYLAVEV